MKLRALFGLLLATALLLFGIRPTYAATFNIADGDVAGLVSAITTANGNNEADTINLAANGTYTLTVVNNNHAFIGPSGLPIVFDDVSGLDLTINGNGATIARADGAAHFRILATGGDSSSNTRVAINGLIFSNGSASPTAAVHNSGGAIFNHYAHMTLTNCTFRDNQAWYGAGIHVRAQEGSATTIVNGCTFSGNIAAREGGSIRNLSGPNGMATLTVEGSLFAGNTAQSGGAIFTDGFDGTGQVSLTRSTFDGNIASSSGGAVFNHGLGGGTGSVTAMECLFIRNQAQTGAGIVNDGASSSGSAGSATFTLFRCALIGNVASSPTAGLANGGAARNVAANASGGQPSASMAFYQCTLADNSAYRGGGIYNATGGAGLATTLLVVHNSTISRNSAAAGEAASLANITGASGTNNIEIGGTILHRADTTTANIVSTGGSFTSLGYNLSDDNTAGLLTGTADQINTDPKLDPLGWRDNGGLTPTIALMQGPAVDKSKNFDAAPIDQRGPGFPRTYDSPFFNNASGGDGTDIGAYEAPPDVLQTGDPQYNVNTLTDHDDGTCGILDCTLREAINRANTISGANTILFLVGGTITLDGALGPLTVTGPTTLAGFGARAMTISGGNSTPVFHVSGGPSFFSGLTIRDGRSSSFLPTPVGGAGLYNTGTLTVNICAFVNNQAAAGAGGSPGATGGLAQGAGVFNAAGGVLTFNRCTFAGNIATGGRGANGSGNFVPGAMGGAAQGGALFNDSGGTLTLSLCTLSGNSATGGAGGNNTSGFGGNGGAGGGAGVFNRGMANVRASTVARNAGLGGAGGAGNTTPNNGAPGTGVGGIQHASGTATMRNSIAALNTGNAGPDVVGAFTSEGYNFIGIGNTASGFNGIGDQVGTSAAPFDPGLGPLQDNGGPTDTLALLEFSPAIDTGHSFGLTSDQRGQPRPSDHPFFPNAPGGNGADIGAFEFGAVLLVNTLDDHNDGACDPFDCSLREAINAANIEVGDQFITFVPGLVGIIQLNSALPTISATAFLQGPGADRLTVRRDTGGNYRIFNISNGTSNGPFVSIRGLTIANGRVGSDTVLEPGGGILVDRSVIDMQYCALVGNQANTHGGGVFITERSTSEPSLIEACTFSGNSTTGGVGGGLCVTSAAVKVVNCTFSGNSSNFYGGAMFSGLAGPSGAAPDLGVESCTLSGNNAINGGGGISKADVGRLFLTNNIFNNNGGGSLHTFGQAPMSQGHNLSSDAGGGYLTATGDMVNTNPMLDVLAFNGGPIQTHALLPGSPAINAGWDLNPSDQRGYPRIGIQDIGAFEFDSFALRITSITRLANGHILLEGKGVVNATFSIKTSSDLLNLPFGVTGQANSDLFGNWQFEDMGSTGLTKRFYRASFP